MKILKIISINRTSFNQFNSTISNFAELGWIEPPKTNHYTLIYTLPITIKSSK
jgi:hypothetical protein